MLTAAGLLFRILAKTTRENSTESVDRVFALLLQRGKNTRFISEYREESRTYHDDTQPRLNAAEQTETEYAGEPGQPPA